MLDGEASQYKAALGFGLVRRTSLYRLTGIVMGRLNELDSLIKDQNVPVTFHHEPFLTAK